MEQQKEEIQVLLRRRDVELRVALSRSSLYQRIADGTFPPPLKLVGGRAVRWLEADLNIWVSKQIKHNRKVGQSTPEPTTAESVPSPANADRTPRERRRKRTRLITNQASARGAR